MSLSGFSESGTLTLNADMTFAQSVLASGSLQITYPQSCLATAGVTCASLDTQIQADLASSSFQSASCSGAGNCTCTLVLKPQTVSGQGTYTTAGTTLSLAATTGVVTDDAYCVQTDTLHLMTVDASMTMGAMGTATIESDVVFTK